MCWLANYMFSASVVIGVRVAWPNRLDCRVYKVYLYLFVTKGSSLFEASARTLVGLDVDG